MSEKLEEISFRLNDYHTAGGVTFDAVLSEQGDTLEVTCSENPDFPIVVTATDTQIISVTPLFALSDVVDDKRDELNKILLALSPVVPLSAIGLQEDMYILFGSMAVNTVFENLAHELEVQADNTLEVLDALKDFLK
ncbi:MAG: DUF2170 family protein [Exilibacterium sp.]